MNYEGPVFEQSAKKKTPTAGKQSTKYTLPTSTEITTEIIKPLSSSKANQLQALSQSHHALWKNNRTETNQANQYDVPFIEQGDNHPPEGLVFVDKKIIEEKVNATTPNQTHQVAPPKVQSSLYDQVLDNPISEEKRNNTVPFLDEQKNSGRAQPPRDFPDYLPEELESDLDKKIVASEDGQEGSELEKEKMAENNSSNSDLLAQAPSEKSTYTPALYQDALFELPEQVMADQHKYKPTDFTQPLEDLDSDPITSLKDKPIIPYQKERKVVQSSLFEEESQTNHPLVQKLEEGSQGDLLDIRSISKRLRKNKDSFLLFEREEGGVNGNI